MSNKKKLMNFPPKVSVVMITYGHEAFIADAINGVLMQEVDFEVELIIANDCSPDNTEAIVNSFGQHEKYCWIKYTRHFKNKGMMPNFIWALKKAKGEFIALCEGDDYWTDPVKLQKQVDFLEANEEYSLYLGNLQRIAEHEQDGGFKTLKVISNTSFSLTSGDLLKHPFHGVTASAMYRKSAFRTPEFLQKVKVGEIALWMIVSKHGLVYFSNEVFGVYRKHLGSISISESYKSDSPELLKSYLWFYLGLLKYYEGNLFNEISDKTIYFFIKLWQMELKNKKQFKLFQYIHLFKQFPGIFKVYFKYNFINKIYSRNKINIDNREITFLSENVIVVRPDIINSFIEVEVQDKIGVENIGEFMIGGQKKIFLSSNKIKRSNSFAVKIRNLEDNSVKVLKYK